MAISVRNLLRSAIAIVVTVEGLAFLAGAALHLGIPLPGPYVEARSWISTGLEVASAALLLAAAVAIAARRREAWKLAVSGHVLGVAAIAWGIVHGGAAYGAQSSHHPPMLLLLIVVLIALSAPVCRQALETGRHRPRRRRKAIQTLL